MEKLTVRVTKADIKCSYGFWHNNCPVAAAMNRALALNDGYATDWMFYSETMDDIYFELPQKARDWIVAYDRATSADNPTHVAPFSFDLISTNVKSRKENSII